MRTFAHQPQATQQMTSAESPTPDRAHFGQRREGTSLRHLPRTLGPQALQRMSQTHAEDLPGGLAVTASPHFAYAFSQISVHPTSPANVQAQRTVGPPKDTYEQAAGRGSRQVMRVPEPQLQRACACGGACPTCQTEQPGQDHERLQPRRVQASTLAQSAAPPIVHEVLDAPGQPLDPTTRAFMEPRFGHDFSRVRVHTDAKATASAQAVQAAAYTVGCDIVFNQNHYDPHSAPGRFLLAHELAHTLQQGQTDSMSAMDRAALHIGAPNDRSEAEADDIAAWLFSGRVTLRTDHRAIDRAPAPGRAASVAGVCPLGLHSGIAACGCLSGSTRAFSARTSGSQNTS
jgi:Domain of unknown function (DUF4157)